MPTETTPKTPPGGSIQERLARMQMSAKADEKPEASPKSSGGIRARLAKLAEEVESALASLDADLESERRGRMHAFVHRQRIGTPLQQSLGGFAQARLARAGQQGALVVVVIGRPQRSPR